MPCLLSTSNTLAIANNSSYELWIKYITGDSSLAKQAQKWCEDICNTILKIHALTGYDATSKAGTKAAALKANYHLLASSGQTRRPIFSHLNKLKNDFVLFLTQKKIAMHLTIYDIFFIQRRTKRCDLCHLLLICDIDIFLGHFISI